MNSKSKSEWEVAIVIAGIAGFCAIVWLLVSGCAAPRKTAPAIAKAGPPDPCPECPKCTNCIPTNTWPAINTNGIWLEVVSVDMTVSPARVVTRANNLTNGVTYYWERTDHLGLLEWIPLSFFTATGPTAYRTNGIANPQYNFWRLRWQQ